ncbi:MAG: hypothetical protein ACHQZR_04525 [Candidatus Limnocylindrales bacterium]
MIDETSRLDAYVEGVLAGRRAGPQALISGEGLDPAARQAADLLARTLVRFHPSFRFEEALAGRLRAEAAAMRGGSAPSSASDAGRVVPFPLAIGEPTAGHARGLLVGGAIASGLSLAGAAFLAWRRGHRVAS